jgi:hypothetical protein
MKKTHPIARLRQQCTTSKIACLMLLWLKLYGYNLQKACGRETWFYFLSMESTMGNWFINRWLPQLKWCGGTLVSGKTATIWKGILPSWSSIQRCAYGLHSLGQEHICFERKECTLGECFASDYEKLFCFLLQSFSLYDVAHREQ